MVKSRKIKVKSIENEKIIMAMTMTKTIIIKNNLNNNKKRMKIGNHIKL